MTSEKFAEIEKAHEDAEESLDGWLEGCDQVEIGNVAHAHRGELIDALREAWARMGRAVPTK